MTPTSIETVTGRFVDLVNPDPATICIEDIAWALSRMPRYVGHTVTAQPYTIGQHSVFVTDLTSKLFMNSCEPGLKQSFLDFIDQKAETDEVRAAALAVLSGPMPTQLALELLMHDASEGYIVDVPTPLKMADGFRDVYLHLEDQMMETIRTAFSMPHQCGVHRLFVKWADAAALTIEAYHLIRSRGSNWTRLLQLDMATLQMFEDPKPSIEVYKDFLMYYEELKSS